MPNRPDAPDDSDRDDRLNRVIAAYLEAAENGSTPDRNALLADHPDLTEPLRDYFSALDEVSTLVADLTPLPRSRERIPHRFGAYEVLAEIGRGGMGVVYRARQTVPDRLVALKMIRPALWVTTADVRRFRTEAESAARLDHPNIVPIHEIGESDGHLFFSMKLCSGGNLAGLAADGRPAINPRRAVELVAAVAHAIHHAHQRGILHRDLKPSNVLLDEAGHPYVADFGLAKVLDAECDLTATGAVLGTPGYLAPEMVPALTSRPSGRAPVATTAVDVYGLGTVLYFLLAGRPPFRGASLAETLALVQARDPVSPRSVNPRVDRDLDAVCLHCLEKDPARRYPSAEALAEDLGRWLAGKPTRARPVGRLARARRWLTRNPVSAALAALVLLSAGGGLTALAVSYRAVVAEREASLNSQRETAEYAEHLRTRVYAGDIRLAHALWQRGESAACRATLDRYRPQEGEIDLRGWEWHYIDALLRGSPLESAKFPSPSSKFESEDHVPRDIAYHAAISPDGRLVASGWQSGWIYLWEPWSGIVRKPIFAHVGDVNWVAFIGDGRQLASAGEDGTIKIWDVATGKRVGEVMKDQSGAVESIAVTPDGKRLISGGADGILRVWDLPNRKRLHEIPGHTRNIEGVAVSPDGRLAASAAFDGNVQVWDFSGPEPRRKWVVDAENTLYAVAFSPDGGRVAVVRADSSMVELDATSGRRLGRNSNEVGKYRGVTYVPGTNGMLLAVGDDGRMRAWDVNREEFLWATPAHATTVWSVACSLDGRFAVTAGSDTTVRVWSLQPPPARSLDSSRGSVSYLFPHASGVLFQTCEAQGQTGESAWNFRLDGNVDAISAHGANTPASAVSPDQRLIAFAAADGSIVLRDCSTNSDRRVDEPPAPPPKFGWPRGDTVRFLQFLPEGRLAALYSDGTLGLIPLTGGVPAFHDRMTSEYTGGLASISRNHLAVAMKSRLRIYDLERDDWLQTEFRPPSRIESFAAAADGSRAVLGLSTGGIKVIALPEAREELDLFGHAASVVAVAYSPDGKTIASACSEGIVRLWHAATGQELFDVEDRRGRAITSLAFTADGRLLVAGKAFPDGRTITVHDPGKPPN